MAISTLAVAFDGLQADVGFFLGYGRGAKYKQRAWTQKQLDNIERSIKGGMRKFYYSGHRWSFMSPVADLTLASGANTVVLPEDFGGMDPQIVIATPQGTAYTCLNIGPVTTILEQEARWPNTTGRPKAVALETLKGTAQSRAEQSQLHFWPTADSDYGLKVQYYLLADYLTGTKPYAYGGPEHAETLLEACLSVAEKVIDNTAEVHAAEFAVQLKTSIDLDANRKPKNLGYNLDRSDLDATGRGWIERYTDAKVTFEGVQY